MDCLTAQSIGVSAPCRCQHRRAFPLLLHSAPCRCQSQFADHSVSGCGRTSSSLALQAPRIHSMFDKPAAWDVLTIRSIAIVSWSTPFLMPLLHLATLVTALYDNPLMVYRALHSPKCCYSKFYWHAVLQRPDLIRAAAGKLGRVEVAARRRARPSG